MQFDCASRNAELKLYDFAYKRVIVVRKKIKRGHLYSASSRTRLLMRCRFP